MDILYHICTTDTLNNGVNINILDSYSRVDKFSRGKSYPDLQAKHGKALKMVQTAIDNCSKIDLYHAPAGDSIEVNTLLLPEEPFYIGESYHQRYYEKTGGEPYCHMRTKKAMKSIIASIKTSKKRKRQ